MSTFLLCALLLLPLCRAQAQTSDVWRGIDIASSSDNKTRLLWRHSDGSITLQTLDVSDAVESGKKYGPFTGYSAITIAAGADLKTRVLWRHTDGTIALWVVSAAGDVETNTNFGPYAGWTATDIAVGDNKTRVLWVNNDGRMSVWHLGLDGQTLEFNATYGPIAGWSAKAIGVGGDLKTRVMWRNSDGRMSVWTIASDGSLVNTPAFGPYPGWTALDMAVGSDNKIRVLWTNSDGSVGLWRLSLDGQTAEVSVNQGPFAGWTAAAIAVGGDGKTRVLWNHTDGRVSTWRVSLDGLTAEAVVTFGPYTSANPPPAPAPPPSTIAPSGVTLNPTKVLGGTASTGTVTLASAAPTGGSSVALSSNNPSATVPATVTVAAGATSAQFTISTTAVSSSTTATISATSGGVTKTAALVVKPRFEITNINNGDVLSGYVQVEVVVYGNADDLTLKIGNEYSTKGNLLPRQSGVEILGFAVQTEHLSNGAQTLVVTDGSSSDTRAVTFQNIVSNLSYDGIFDSSGGDSVTPLNCRITANVPSGGNWSLEVRNTTDQIVKTFNGTGTALDVAWNGTNNAGGTAPGGTFKLFFKPPPGALAGDPTIWVGITNNSRYDSDVLILLDTTAFTHPSELQASTPGNVAYCLEYADFIRSQVSRSLAISGPVTPLVVSPALLQKSSPAGRRMAKIINNRLRRPLKLVYVAAHGNYTLNAIYPYFGIGGFNWYSGPNNSTNPGGVSTINGESTTHFNVRELTAPLDYGGGGNYNGDGFDPPMLVWMDNCASAGAYTYGSRASANPTSADSSWAEVFGVDYINGYGGAFLGWNGWSITSGQQWAPEWATWRGELWRSLFERGRNLTTAIRNADTAANNQTSYSLFGDFIWSPSDRHWETGFLQQSF